jgi:hypothetical protein
MEMAIVLYRLQWAAKLEKLHGCFPTGMMLGSLRPIDQVHH